MCYASVVSLVDLSETVRNVLAADAGPARRPIGADGLFAMFNLGVRQGSLVTVLACLVFLVGGAATADVPEAEAHEVRHLLEYLRTSDCSMERNGERHSAVDAYVHVKKKYDYFRGRISTSEEFIEYAATKSTMTGRYYRVLCPGEPPKRARDWFLEELLRYRG